MIHPATTHTVPGEVDSASLGISRARRYVRTIYLGPKVLLTSRITGKCAAFMMLMCAPSLLFCSLLTLPALIFQSPQQHAYFQFSRVLEQDPSRWAVLLLVSICTLMSLAVPANMAAPKISEGY